MLLLPVDDPAVLRASLSMFICVITFMLNIEGQRAWENPSFLFVFRVSFLQFPVLNLPN